MKFIPAVGGEFSGSVGGWTASRNRYGQYFRRRAVPVNPSSLPQQSRRAAFAGAVQRWTTVLTADQRLAWNEYAANTPVVDNLGRTIYLTGQAMYVRSQSVCGICGKADLTDAPTSYDLGTFTPLATGTISAAAGELEQTFNNADPWAIAVGGFALFFFGKNQNASRAFYGGPWIYGDSIAGAVVPPGSPASIGTSITPVEDNKMWYYYRIFQVDGRLSNMHRLGPVTVGA